MAGRFFAEPRRARFGHHQMIPRPRYPANHPDRLVECEMGAEEAFLELVERIEDAGWSRKEAVAALLSLAVGHLKQIRAAQDDDVRRADARRRRGH